MASSNNKSALTTVIVVIVLVVALGWGWMAWSDSKNKDIVGAWEVAAEGAPYVPHLFTFASDGTVFTTNPTNVQEDPSAPNGGTNDSVGMGTWRVEKIDGKNYVVGTFEQLNALADTHEPTDKLFVTFKISLEGDDAFGGPAMAKLGDLSAPANLDGTRIKVDESTLDDL
jgi:hypothetical protein